MFKGMWNGEMPSCDIGTSRIYLNAQGHYYPCDSMHKYIIGDVQNNTLESVWNGEKLNYLRRLRNSDFGDCAICAKRPWCKVCPAANFNATGSLFKSLPMQCELAGAIKCVFGNSKRG